MIKKKCLGKVILDMKLPNTIYAEMDLTEWRKKDNNKIKNFQQWSSRFLQQSIGREQIKCSKNDMNNP